MNNARKKIRICLVCVVMAAVIVGLIYYFNDVRSSANIDEGTLVRQETSFGKYTAVQDAGAPESRG